VSWLTLSPDGKLLAGGRDTGDRTLIVWRLTDKGLEKVPFPKTEARNVAFSPDGKTLAVVTGSVIRLWDLTSPVPTVRASLTEHQSGGWGGIRALAFSADGRLLASAGGGQVIVWDSTTGAGAPGMATARSRPVGRLRAGRAPPGHRPSERPPSTCLRLPAVKGP